MLKEIKMTTTELKKDIHKYVDCIQDEEYLKGLHALLIDKAAKSTYSLTPEQIRTVKERESEYLRGETKATTWEEAKEYIRKNKLNK